MPPAFNMNFNPAQVMMGQNGNRPYLNTIDPKRKPVAGPVQRAPGFDPSRGDGRDPANPIQRQPGFGGPTMGQNPVGSPIQGTSPFGVLGSEAVRATGQGPFDPSFRQDLSTYAGGQFQRPGGMLGFNPTGQSIGGSPVGGGNDPTLGNPNNLIAMALGGQSFQYGAPGQAKKQQPQPFQSNNWQDWIKQLMGGGRTM